MLHHVYDDGMLFHRGDFEKFRKIEEYYPQGEPLLGGGMSWLHPLLVCW